MSQLELSILSWNVNGEGGIAEERVTEQLEFLREHASGVDIVLLQAVNYDAADQAGWHGQVEAVTGQLSEEGYEVIHTADWAHELHESTVQPQQAIHGPHDRCNLTASRWPITRTSLTLRDKGPNAPQLLTTFSGTFPEKLLVGTVDLTPESIQASLDVWNVGIIHGAGWGEEKLKMLETVYARLHAQANNPDRPVVLGGDFNAPKRETAEKITPHGANKPLYTDQPFYGAPYYLAEGADEPTAYSFRDRWRRAERLLFDSDVGDWAMRDAYWVDGASAELSSEADYTHVNPSASPTHKRLDHVMVSPQFTVERCEIWNGRGDTPDGLGLSDHAPVYVDLLLNHS